MLLHQIIELNARKTPDATAVSDDRGIRYSWSQFNGAADAMAAAMAGAGVRRGDAVALLAKNSCDFFVVFIAANKLGAAFAPLNYRFAAAEVTAVLRDSRPRMVIVEDPEQELAREVVAELPELTWCRLADGLPRLGGARPEPGAPGTASPGDVEVPLSEDQVSLICYTGGTSGRSKGVRLSHRNLLANAYNWTIHDEIRPDDVYLAAGALFHIGVAAPFAFWLAGARCVVMNFEPGRALGLIESEGVTKAVASGTIFKMLVDEQERRPRAIGMRRIDCGAAPVPLALVERARRVLGCPVGQIYGQTEGCFSLTYLYPEEYDAALVDAPTEPALVRVGSVGRAVALTELAVVDAASPTLEFLQPGQVGEVVARGPNVMQGYTNMLDHSAETVVGGWLRTGDLGELDQEGYLYLRGRKKDMIITGGENVYAHEVELALLECPAVDEAVVIGVPDDHWGELVTAVVTVRPGAEVEGESLRQFCRSRLAGYKIPKTVIVRDDMPRLSSNKIDKISLRRQYRPEGCP